MFVRIYETQSLSEAARELRTTQPTVSRRLMALERALGARLFERNTRGLSPTEAGELYYERSKRWLAEMEEVEEQIATARRSARGRLRVSVPVNIGQVQLARIVFAFQHKHPGVQVELSLSDRVVDLVKESVDVAIRSSTRSRAGPRRRARVSNGPRALHEPAPSSCTCPDGCSSSNPRARSWSSACTASFGSRRRKAPTRARRRAIVTAGRSGQVRRRSVARRELVADESQRTLSSRPSRSRPLAPVQPRPPALERPRTTSRAGAARCTLSAGRSSALCLCAARRCTPPSRAASGRRS